MQSPTPEIKIDPGSSALWGNSNIRWATLKWNKIAANVQQERVSISDQWTLWQHNSNERSVMWNINCLPPSLSGVCDLQSFLYLVENNFRFLWYYGNQEVCRQSSGIRSQIRHDCIEWQGLMAYFICSDIFWTNYFFMCLDVTFWWINFPLQRPLYLKGNFIMFKLLPQCKLSGESPHPELAGCSNAKVLCETGNLIIVLRKSPRHKTLTISFPADVAWSAECVQYFLFFISDYSLHLQVGTHLELR